MPETVLEAPPQVTVKRRNVVVRLRRFKFALNRRRRLGQLAYGVAFERATASKVLASTKRLSVTYEVTLSAKKVPLRADVRRKVSNRATVTYNNLPPGKYTVTFRAMATQPGSSKPIFRTNQSPKKTFVVR